MLYLACSPHVVSHETIEDVAARLGRGLATRPVIGRSNIFFPWLGLEKQVPAEQMRVRMTEFSSQAALCYALLGGISAAALLSPEANKRAEKATKPPSPLAEHVNTMLGKGWAERLGPPLWCSSVFFNLQGLIASMFTLAHANAMPDAGIAALARAQPVAIHATGLCLVPAIATLSGALVCSVETLHGAEATLVAGAGVVAMGVATTLQMIALHLASFRIRRAIPALRRSPLQDQRPPWRRTRAWR